MKPDDYCQQKAAASGSSAYYSFLFLADEQRRAMTALEALVTELGEAVSGVSETGVAQMKLAWWRAEIERIFDDRPSHPVARALAPAVERFALPRARFAEIVRGVELDLEHEGFACFDDLADYCYYAGSAARLLAAEIAGYGDPATRDYARDLGIALRLADTVRDVRADARHGRIYLPANDMEAHGVQAQDLLAATTPPALRALLADQAARARDYYARALATLPAADRRAQLSDLIRARLSMTLLDEIEADGFRVLERRVALTPVRKLWIAWRTRRGEQWRHGLRRLGVAAG